ncbi:Conserved_hypothetical protein [Hexamita inflata]|uniref:Uncharacterized protein n=1 Tax=Hexamita inflata TaxID=28002 RepID=A0AA86QKR6_9EUKA|nr:Conserved hypothetical protein [Hexamita inflata]
MLQKNHDAKKINEFNQVTNKQRTISQKIMDLGAILRERCVNLQDTIYPKTFHQVDELELPRSLNDLEYSQIIPEINAVLLQRENTTYIIDLFERGTLFQMQSEGPIVTACFARQQLFVFYPYQVKVVMCQNEVQQQMKMMVGDDAIEFSTQQSSPKFYFANTHSITCKFQITCATATSNKVFFGDIRGTISEVEDNSEDVSSKTHYIPILNDFIMKKSKLIQLVADCSRSLLYSLDDQGKVSCFEVSTEFKQIKSLVQDPQIKKIQPIQAQQSYGINLASSDSSGRVSFYTLNDQGANQYIDLNSFDSNVNTALKMLHQNKFEPKNKLIINDFKHRSGFFLFSDGDQVLYHFIDQSVKKQRKYFCDAGEIQLNLQHGEKILDVEFVNKKLINELPKMDNRFQDFNLVNQFVSAQKFVSIVTNKRLITFAAYKVYQNIGQMLRVNSADVVKKWALEIFDETEAVAMIAYAALCESPQAEIAHQVRMQQQCLVQFSTDYQQSPKPQNLQAEYILQDYAKSNSAVFVQSMQILIGRLLAPVYSYQLFYAPSVQQQGIIELHKQSIPILFSNLEPLVEPIITFNYIELFNLGTHMNEICAYLTKQTNQVKNAPQYQNMQQKLGQSLNAGLDLQIDELTGCLVYVKELLFFFSLCFMPQNCSRVIPELQFLSQTNSTGNIDGPQFGNGTVKNAPGSQIVQYQYKQSQAMQFEFYLNSQNKQHMELLVRKLNQITGQANTKLNAQTYQQSFDEQFKRLCTALARIYQTRLGAIQELEQAAQTQTQQEKLQRVQTATNKLKQSKKSLLPLEPLIENYTKCDSLQLLVNLILLQYDQQYEQCGYILNAKHQYSKAFEQMLDQARSVYSRADVQSTFVMTLNAITPPYKLENQFDQVIADIKQIYSMTANTGKASYGINQVADSKIPETQLDEIKTISNHVFKIIESGYIFSNIPQILKNEEISKSQQTRGLSIIQAAVQGSKSKFWHVQLYQFLYSHYYNASVLLDIESIKGSFSVMAHTCLLHVQKKCSDALLSIMSPYIEHFLKETDYELYIQMLQKSRKTQDLLRFIHMLIEQQTQTSILPTLFDNVYRCRPLNFYQSYKLIQMASSVLKIETFANNSLYASVAVSQFASQLQEPDQNVVTMFSNLLEVAKIQQELIERTKQENFTVQLMRSQVLDQQLKETHNFDLALVLTLNSAKNGNMINHITEPLWTSLLQNGQNNQQTLSADISKVYNVLSRTRIEPISLKIPFIKLVQNYLFMNAADLAKEIVDNLFRKFQYGYIGNCVKAGLQLVLDHKNNLQLCEYFAMLVIKMVEVAKSLPTLAEGDEPIQSGIVMQKLKASCPIHSIQEILKKW